MISRSNQLLNPLCIVENAASKETAPSLSVGTARNVSHDAWERQLIFLARCFSFEAKLHPGGRMRESETLSVTFH